ncbi:Hint domain-containing protein [Aestuariicoccus sp. MJ-SS9]|uniref:Hint domain-containing protein n=1 Tax=Aestuariicoccus sp. MJ-SS9 TaxID=3079855 RepID=UPI00290D3AB3|nr:Hint domain-containing protein [Aestuariicoccus sp. MJ-SS9]MDU8913012.1 Hint domain-containing protein [Aestuariicoccus sp. MJ-SS9]
MADLILDWAALGAYGANLEDTAPDAVTATVDTGGVAVDITFTAQDAGASAFTFDVEGYVAEGEPFDPFSHLKLFGEGGDGGVVSPTSTTVLDFRGTDAMYTDNVQNVSFRLNDVDQSGSSADFGDPGAGFEDNVTVLAYDADGNAVPVSLTPAGNADVSGGSATGTSTSEFEAADGSVLVNIAGPVSRIEIVYENGDVEAQGVLVSDVYFSTVDAEDDNLPPVAVDDIVDVDMNTETVIDAAANDTDPDGDPVTVASIGDPANGTAVLNADGTVSYTPNFDYIGEDTISYVASDGNGGTDEGQIIVTVVNTDPDEPPVAVDDTLTTELDTSITLNPTDNDIDPEGQPLFVSEIGTPANGTAVLNGDGTVTYTPNPGFLGDDSFTYEVVDTEGLADFGTVYVTVEEAPAEPRIDTDVFPVDPADQALDPLDGLDEDPDPSDDLDDITGTGGADSIATGDDDDTISGGAGDDVIEPGIDDDVVDGGTGNDTIIDVQGADTIYGGQGDDVINAGIDTFSDYEGDDPSFAPGTPLNDLGFTADPNQEDGRDSVQGNRGNDIINTGDDRDTIDGGGENDTINAGIDDDLVMGGQGDDSIIGSHGSDTLDGGQGNDYIDGSNFAALELVDAIDTVPENDRDLIDGALGDDTLIGGDDDDTLIGGSGDDSLDGGIDEDSLLGGADDDTLIGGQGDDTLDGGAGVDMIDGGTDRDTIVVGSASEGIGDTVQGGFEGDDFDTLDLSGAGERGTDWRLVDVRPDDDGPGRDPNGIDGTVEFLDGAGGVTGTMDFFNIEQVVPCFTPGTLIATPQGEKLVEDLREGDRVITRDNGIQEIRWVGRKDLTGHVLARKPHMKPILIQKGALGNGLPEHDMLLSPNHRVLVNNDKTALYFEEREVLAAAKHLIGLEGVDEVRTLGVSYIHFMFDSHEVVLSNGAWTESFQPGDYSLNGIGNAQRQEILELFPELAEADGLNAYASARRSLKKHEAQLLTK